MSTIIRADQRAARDHGWLQTRYHFSFNDYHDPANVRFGPLRVFNDDIIRPAGGFPTHPHRDMEIITVVLEGEIAHRDNTGETATLGPGGVQVMTAGSGITHSEFNASQTEDLHLLQIWILPRTQGSEPGHDHHVWDLETLRNRLVPLVVPREADGPLTIDQDATLLRGILDSGQSVSHDIRESRRAYLFMISGEVALGDQKLLAGDQARLTDPGTVNLEANTEADVLLIDLP